MIIGKKPKVTTQATPVDLGAQVVHIDHAHLPPAPEVRPNTPAVDVAKVMQAHEGAASDAAQ